MSRVAGIPRALAVYRSQLKLAVSDEDPLRSLWKRVKSKSSKMIFRLFHHGAGRPGPRLGMTIEEVNVYAASNYQPKAYPGTLTLFRATTRGPLDGDDEFLGWGGLVGERVEVHHVPATHLNILQEPAVRVLSEKLRSCLDRDPFLPPKTSRLLSHEDGAGERIVQLLCRGWPLLREYPSSITQDGSPRNG